MFITAEQMVVKEGLSIVRQEGHALSLSVKECWLMGSEGELYLSLPLPFRISTLPRSGWSHPSWPQMCDYLFVIMLNVDFMVAMGFKLLICFYTLIL